eukprot:TRINITY_DN2018_c0_g4_i1.p1 TRINITY_DN2018_c0_g4~~TRINITY_DN2018_c0_g4_i1.p1  ORF type:complete len:281 (+),score=51.56 TRINITY_DN2018_c0_g4_i1:59-844(+)
MEWNARQMTVHYGMKQVERMYTGMSAREDLLPCLAIPGIGSRFDTFHDWLFGQNNAAAIPTGGVEQAIAAFSDFLGRVTTYRALSLSPEQYHAIEQADVIFPTGRLRVGDEQLRQVVADEGVRKVAFARLYIGLGLIEHDPSVSLHDDPETAVCISGGYLERGKAIYLMQLRVPKIESLGFRICDIHNKGSRRWFVHRGAWFDSEDERTERFTLYGVPFFKSRLLSLRVIKTNEEADAFVARFKEQQLARKNQTEAAAGGV